MIKIFDKTSNIEIKFELSKFPDGTSQIWQLNPEPKRFSNIDVKWDFESENEVFYLCQLGYLLWQEYVCNPVLVANWLPYARQDKAINNKSTFAKEVFIQLIDAAGYDHIETYDAHSPHWFISSRQPVELIEAALPGHHIVCFPDAGAKTRYLELVQDIARNSFQDDVEFIWAEKKRNQQTGEIEGLELVTNGIDLTGKNILVLDDLIDGGKTFTELAFLLLPYKPKKFDLAVSHGLFSKGKDNIYISGYNKIYATNSLKKNENHGDVWMTLNSDYFIVVDINGELK